MANSKKTRKRKPQRKSQAVRRLIDFQEKTLSYIGNIRDVKKQAVEADQIINTKFQIITLAFLDTDKHKAIIEKLGLTDVLSGFTEEMKYPLAEELFKTITLMRNLRESSRKLIDSEEEKLLKIVNETIPPMLKLSSKEITMTATDVIAMEIMNSKIALDQYNLKSQYAFSFSPILTDIVKKFGERGSDILDKVIDAHGTYIKGDKEKQDELIGWMQNEGLDGFFDYCAPHTDAFIKALEEEGKTLMEEANAAKAEEQSSDNAEEVVVEEIVDVKAPEVAVEHEVIIELDPEEVEQNDGNNA